MHRTIDIIRCFGYPRKYNFWFNTEPTCCTEGCELRHLFSSKLQEYIHPRYSTLSSYIILIPCLLVFFISIQRIVHDHELVCDYNKMKVQQLKTFCASVGACTCDECTSHLTRKTCSVSPSTVLVPVLAIRTASNCWRPALNVVVAHGPAYRREGAWLFRPCVRLCKVSGVIC